jgi:hypothetical protein
MVSRYYTRFFCVLGGLANEIDVGACGASNHKLSEIELSQQFEFSLEYQRDGQSEENGEVSVHDKGASD